MWKWLQSWRWTRWMVVRRRKEELRYDGQGPYWSCVAAPRRRGSLAASSSAFVFATPAQQSPLATGCWQKFQKLDNQSKFSKERFSKNKLCRLALARMLPHKAEVEGSSRLQLQFPDAKLCRQQANGTTPMLWKLGKWKHQKKCS